MSNIYGLLKIDEAGSDAQYVNSIGQQIVYDAIQEEIKRINSELDYAKSIFVSETTEDYKRRYKLPGSGYMQPRALLARPADVKLIGSWDVAFPLFDFGDAFSADKITLAYLSIKDLNNQLDTVQARAANTVRREILKAMFNNTNLTFPDSLRGDLTCVPLANNDTVVYPSAAGAEAEATENHYLLSGYASADISDTNDPISTITAELVEHFPGSDVVVFINKAQLAKVQGLTDFEDVLDSHIVAGANANTVVGLPDNLPGRVRGRHAEGAWVVEWSRIPAGYMVGIAMDAPKPIIERVDPAYTNIPRGVYLHAIGEEYPLESSFFNMRCGYGVGNRLNGVVMKLATDAYSVPTAYAR